MTKDTRNLHVRRTQLVQGLSGVLKDRGISQNKLADILGINQDLLSGIMKGSSNPTLSTLCRIEDALGGNLLSKWFSAGVTTRVLATLPSFITVDDLKKEIERREAAPTIEPETTA
jgi:transcriptional regulator with XRE-family HTH domain